MTRFRRYVVAAVAGCAVLAGCSSGVPPSTVTTDDASTGGTPTSGSVVTSAESPASSPGAPPPSSVAPSNPSPVDPPPADLGSPGADPSAAVVPAVLDAQSASWFDGVCNEMTVDLPTADGDLPPQAIVDYVQSLSAAMIGTAHTATTLPPPTIDGGTELVVGLAASMSAAGTDLAARVASYLADMNGVNAYSADSSLLASRLTLRAAFQPLTSVDPAVNAALGQFPACQAYGF